MRALLILAALAWCVESFAVDRCVAMNGTKTTTDGTGGCAGTTCTATEWITPSMCYPPTHAGIQNALIDASAAGASETVTLQDGETAVTSTITPTSVVASGGTLTIRCRTDEPGSCWVSFNGATTTVWSLADTDANLWKWENVGCRRSVPITNTTVAAGCINATGSGVTGITLDSVVWRDISFDWTGVTQTAFGGLINVGASPSNITVTISGESVFEDINFTAASGAGVLIRLGGTTDLNITGLTIQDITTKGAPRLIECNDTCTISGLTIQRWTAEEVTADVINGAIYASDTTLPLSVTDSTFSDNTIRGVSPRGGFIDAAGPTTISDVECSRNTVTATVNTDPSSPCVFGTGASAVLTVTDMLAEDNVGQYGIIYTSQGASSTVKRLHSRRNQIMQAASLYCGGWGDCALESSIVANNTQIDGGEQPYGLAWFCQLQTSATRDRTCTITNSVLANNTLLNTADGSIGIKNGSSNATACGGGTRECQQTAVITNSVIRNGATQELYLNNTQTAIADVVTLVTTTLTDTADPSSMGGGAGTYTETYTTANEYEPGWRGGAEPTTAEGFKTLSTSDLRRAGTCTLTTGCIPRDYGGRRGRVPPDIGAWQGD